MSLLALMASYWKYINRFGDPPVHRLSHQATTSHAASSDQCSDAWMQAFRSMVNRDALNRVWVHVEQYQYRKIHDISWYTAGPNNSINSIPKKMRAKLPYGIYAPTIHIIWRILHTFFDLDPDMVVYFTMSLISAGYQLQNQGMHMTHLITHRENNANSNIHKLRDPPQSDGLISSSMTTNLSKYQLHKWTLKPSSWSWFINQMLRLNVRNLYLHRTWSLCFATRHESSMFPLILAYVYRIHCTVSHPCWNAQPFVHPFITMWLKQ